jgi:multidrug efflux pump subunit AcrB
MKLAEFSVKNPLIVNAVTVLLILAGLMAVNRIEREAFPNFSFDIVTVSADYRGASPDVIEKRITIPLEKELKEVDDIEEMGSISVEGLSLIVLKLDPDAPDKDRIYDDIQRAVNDAHDLPSDLPHLPRVNEVKTKNQPLVEISLSGDLSQDRLRAEALRLEDSLNDVKEIASVVRKGIQDRQIWVEVDPRKMARMDLALSEVVAAIARHNVNVSGGLSKTRQEEWIIRTSGEVQDTDEVGGIVIRANESGDLVRVKDVAGLSDQYEENQQILRTDGTRAFNLLVIKKDKADAIRLMDKLKSHLEEYRKTATPGLKIALVNDLSYYVKRRLHVLTSNGWIGAMLVFLTMVAFLSWRVALGSLVGMATSLLTALAIMHFLGVSVNLISMFGLIIVIGMLVDEDLVVADNISRYLERGLTHEEAAVRGASEVNRAILSTVLTTIIVFVPMLFMSGIFGKFIGDIPRVIIITLTVSLVEALIILPSHLSDLNRTGDSRASHWERSTGHHYYERFRNWYRHVLESCLRHPVLTVAVSFAVTGAAIAYAMFGMKFILFPAKGIEAFFVRVEAELGTPLATTEEDMLPIEKLIQSIPENELDHFVTQVGIMQNDPHDPFTTRGSHVGQIQVFLTPEHGRSRDANAIMEDLRARLPEHGFKKISFDPVRPGPPVGKPVAIRLRGEDYGRLATLADLIEKKLKTIAGTSDIRSDYESGKGELMVDVDPVKAARAGLTYSDIASTVRNAFEGTPASVIRRSDEEIDILVRIPEKSRYDTGAIESLLVRNQHGNLVTLGQVARLKTVPGVNVIKHFEGKRAVSVMANVDESISSSGEVNALMKGMLNTESPEFHGVTVDFTGEEQDSRESIQSLGWAFLMALLTVFFVLLVTFESLMQTLIVLLTIPFGLVGVVIGLSLSGEPFSFLVVIGMIGLTGIVVDGGTLIFVFINRLRQEGLPLREAIVEGCAVRLRSILLTTFTTVLGVIPAAYGLGGNDPFIRPMALALNWGMAGSIVFTLLTIPCLLLLADETVSKLKKMF